MARRGGWIAMVLVLVALQAVDVHGAPWAAAADEAGVPEAFLEGMRYRYVGPSRGGRVTAVAGHPDRPHTFVMGATGGGVWRTTDYGNSWQPVSDGTFATGSIGAIAIAADDPDLIYVSTGSDGLRSNVIVGKGVYRSTDGGDSWTHVGLEDVGNTGAVLIDPRDSARVFVAAIGNPFAPNPERGVYRSTDGGASWDNVLFVSDQTGAVDLEFAPDDPDVVYASLWRAERKPWTIISGGTEGGVYVSRDGGDTWEQATDGLPTGLRGKSDLAVSAADPDRVYVLIEAPGEEGGVYRSDDRGESWKQVTDFQPIRNRPFYYTNLYAHPTDPDVLWGMAEGHWMSEDGGETWESQRTPHGDNHDLWINPDNPDIMIQSNDGGANVSLDGGRTWSSQHNQPTAELYQVDVDDAFPYRLYAGQQDNSTISVPSRPPRSAPGGHTALWESHGGCETGPIVPKPGDPDIVYANCKGRFGVYNRRTGQEQQYYVGFWNLYGRNPKDLPYRFQRTVPVHVSPHDPERVYHASQYVHVTEDGGLTWQAISPDLTEFADETQVASGEPITRDATGEEHFSTLYDVQESPHEPGVIWAGANDGPVHLTRDGGDSWVDVTPPGTGPYGRVQNIEVSPHDPATAYVTILRYQLGDFAPYAFRTGDYGASWTLLTPGDNGIPDDTPVRVVREDPRRPGLLYAGTEFGMYLSLDDGATWQPFQLDLPVTPVTDIKRVDDDLVLSTMGRGFWILYDLTPLYEVGPETLAAPVHLFAASDPYRLRGGGGFRFRPPAADEPEYPSPGASLDYWLAETPDGGVRLEILDAHGTLVRAFSSEEGGEEVRVPEPGMRDWQLERVGTPRLPADAGLHRFVWDLRHAGPWDVSARSGQGGPMVPPGTYTARLTAAGRTLEIEFEARMDPRVTAEGITAADVDDQTALALAVRDLLSGARDLARRLEATEVPEGSDAAVEVEAIRGELLSGEVRYSPVMLLEQIQYLYFNLLSADQRPGKDAHERFAELAAELQVLEERFAGVAGDTADR